MRECSKREQKYIDDYQYHQYADQPDLVAVIGDPEYNFQGSLVGVILYPESRGIEDQQDGREDQQCVNFLDPQIVVIKCPDRSKQQKESKCGQNKIDKFASEYNADVIARQA